VRIDFFKYEGLGNDFVLIDGRRGPVPLIPGAVARILDRHFGIGGDGLMLVRDSESADAAMLFYNPDGSEAEMCGNGIRAFAKYLYEAGGVAKQSLRVETGAGIKTLRLSTQDKAVATVTVGMGAPSFASADIPVNTDVQEVVDMPVTFDGEELRLTCVSMGNPHCVIFWDGDLASAPVEELGGLIERHDLFPRRTNVEFAQVLDSTRVMLRVWERGAGETLACGTGACATAVAAARTGRTSRTVSVRLPGGRLQIDWEPGGEVLMTGPAREVYRGSFELESFIG